MMFEHECAAENAPKFLDWIKNRGGVAVWRSVNLSNPGQSWSTPALTTEGQPYAKPTWESDSKPEKVVTDPAKVKVFTSREVKRFHVAVRRGDGFSFKCTDGSSRKIEREVGKAGDGAYYVFDYDSQEAVIMAPSSAIPLSEWRA